LSRFWIYLRRLGKLLQTLGEGGMGAVFMAQQTSPVKRLVALKLIKLGMDSRQVLTRFEAERQALALMDHPNIAKVLDAGATDSGRPFFVMELVKGVPITRFCDERQLLPASGWSCSSRSARRSSTPTRRASSTGTSSRPTCAVNAAAENPEVIHEEMNHWLSDPNLAGVRDEPSLAKPPPDEEKQWRNLWSHVRSLRDWTVPRKTPAMP
jgi:Protein kinase domain